MKYLCKNKYQWNNKNIYLKYNIYNNYEIIIYACLTKIKRFSIEKYQHRKIISKMKNFEKKYQKKVCKVKKKIKNNKIDKTKYQ